MVEPVFARNLLFGVLQGFAPSFIDQADFLIRINGHEHDARRVEILLGPVPLLAQGLFGLLLLGDVLDKSLQEARIAFIVPHEPHVHLHDEV